MHYTQYHEWLATEHCLAAAIDRILFSIHRTECGLSAPKHCLADKHCLSATVHCLSSNLCAYCARYDMLWGCHPNRAYSAVHLFWQNYWSFCKCPKIEFRTKLRN